MECLICAFPFTEGDRLPAFGSCGHNNVCSICFLRLRSLQRDMSCPMCKIKLDHVICTSAQGARWGDFDLWGDSIGPDFLLDHKSQMFFPKEYFKSKVEKLWTCKCVVCPQVKRDIKTLKAHLNTDHNLIMCGLCIENRQAFPAEHKAYTQADYEKHLRQGDADGSEGHPNCEFCRKRYYDKTGLFTHLVRDHFSCHICERDGLQYKYFAAYCDLETHFRSKHHLCEEEACLFKRFVVFSNAIDLTAHSLQYHPLRQTSRQIQIQFGVRRDNTSGGGPGTARAQANEGVDGPQYSRSLRFEGGMGGRVSNGEWQVELPVSARDPREAMIASRLEQQAAAVHANAGPSNYAAVQECPEEYPSLHLQITGDSGSGAGGGRAVAGGGGGLGWGVAALSTADQRNKDFPQLQGSGGGAAANSGWRARVKTDKKLTVLKNKSNSSTPHYSAAAAATCSSCAASFSEDQPSSAAQFPSAAERYERDIARALEQSLLASLSSKSTKTAAGGKTAKSVHKPEPRALDTDSFEDYPTIHALVSPIVSQGSERETRKDATSQPRGDQSTGWMSAIKQATAGSTHQQAVQRQRSTKGLSVSGVMTPLASSSSAAASARDDNFESLQRYEDPLLDSSFQLYCKSNSNNNNNNNNNNNMNNNSISNDNNNSHNNKSDINFSSNSMASTNKKKSLRAVEPPDVIALSLSSTLTSSPAVVPVSVPVPGAQWIKSIGGSGGGDGDGATTRVTSGLKDGDYPSLGNSGAGGGGGSAKVVKKFAGISLTKPQLSSDLAQINSSIVKSKGALKKKKAATLTK